jgi:hypothetical protein
MEPNPTEPMPNEEDLVLGEEAEEYDDYVEPTAPADGITAVCFALESIDSMDEAVMSLSGKKRKAAIKRKAFKLLDFYISELYGEAFGDDPKDKKEDDE